MNKLDFLSQLAKNLAKLPKEEVKSALDYYEEYFNDAGNEKEELVVKELGSPAKVASQIIANYTINDINSSPKTIKNGLTNIGRTFKALINSSVAFPMAIFMYICAIISLLAMGALIISLLCGSVCLMVIAVLCLIEGFKIANLFESTYIISYLSSAIMIVGSGICCFSIFLIFSNNGFNWIAKFLSKLLLRRGKK